MPAPRYPATTRWPSEPYLIVADLDAASGDNRIRAALAISEADLRALRAEHISEQALLTWDREREAVAARVELRLDAIVLECKTAPITDTDAALQKLLEAIAGELEHALTWTPAARQLQVRALLARRMQPDADWPDLSSDWLRRHVAEWFGPWLVGKTRFADARALDLTEVLKQTLGWHNASRLDELAPELLTTPAGTRRRIDYRACLDADPPAPVLAAPMQELFGSADTPRIFDGRLPLLAASALACRPPAANHPRPGRILAQCLYRGAQRDAWSLPETPLAGGPGRQQCDRRRTQTTASRTLRNGPQNRFGTGATRA